MNYIPLNMNINFKFNPIIVVLMMSLLMISCNNEDYNDIQMTKPHVTRSFPYWSDSYELAFEDLTERIINNDEVELVLLTQCQKRLPADIFNKFCYAAQDQDPFETTEYCWQNTAYLAIETIEWLEDDLSGFLKPYKTKYTLYVLMGSKTETGDSYSYQLAESYNEYIQIDNEYDE